MERLVEKWFTDLFIILTTLNKLFSYTHLFENIYKHLTWYTNGKIIVILYVHGHMTRTVLYWTMTAVEKQKHFCLLGYDTNDTLFSWDIC